MSWTDTHCHLIFFYQKGEIDAVLSRSHLHGIKRLITIGTSPEDWEVYKNLAKQYPKSIYYSVGLHPCEVTDAWPLALEKLEAFLKAAPNPAPVALGEIGLDSFHLPKDTLLAEQLKAQQRAALELQLNWAKQYNLPVVIHSRDCFKECLDVIDKSGINPAKVVFHCFVEGPESIQALLDRSIKASFTGVVTYKNAELIREALLLAGPERCFLETDAPYLAPIPHRGKPNEPSYLVHTAEFCAHLFKISVAALASYTEKAVDDFFHLS